MGNSSGSLAITLLNMLGKLRPTSIKLAASGGAEGTGGEVVNVGGSVQVFQFVNTETNQKKLITFTGIGAGVGVGTPIGASVSSPDLPSVNSEIVQGTSSFGKLEFYELAKECQIWAFGIGAGIGLSGSLVLFGTKMLPPNIPVFFNAAVWLEGLMIASPGASIMSYTGHCFVEDLPEEKKKQTLIHQMTK